MTFQDLGDGVYRVGGARRSAITGRFAPRASSTDTAQDRPLLILAESTADAELLARQIGVDDIVVVTPRAQEQFGWLIRGVVVTPRFATLVEANDLAASEALRTARRNASKLGIEVG